MDCAAAEEDLQARVGRREVQWDLADAQRLSGLAALLDHDVSPWLAGVAPPLGHWLYFQPHARQSQLGPDGHPRRSAASLLPAADFPRRMWAGSRIEFLRDVPIGATIERTSTLSAVQEKSGRSGRMLFATVRHVVADLGGEALIVEDQDIVYREAAAPEPTPARPTVKGSAVALEGPAVTVDSAMLFRFSALTFNAHRIHYDRNYACSEEGYPGLVVHGPFIATLLMDALLRRRPQARVTSFAFRAIQPLFEGEPFGLRLTDLGPAEVGLQAIGPAGVAMTATAGLGA